MRTLVGIGFLLSLATPVAFAAPFDHPCEIVYYEINKSNNTSGYTMEDYLTCKDQFGDTKLIRKAEKYKEESQAYLSELDKRIEESKAVARGERAGKIIQSFDLEQMMAKNINGAAYASFVGFVNDNGEIKRENKIEAKEVCGYLGFDDAVASRSSQRISAGNRSQLQEEGIPDAIFGVVKEKLFGSKQPRTFELNKQRPSRNARIFFEYFESVTCERVIKAGEDVQEFELDIEAIRRAVENDLDAPDLDEDVKLILSLGVTVSNENRDGGNKGLGEVEEEVSEDENWEPSINKNDFFIVVPK